MAQSVEQFLTVTPAGSETPNITLDGDAADISAGGNGQAGTLSLADASGTTRIELESASHRLRLSNADGLEVGLLGPNADLTLGGNDSAGDVVLKDREGQVRATLSANLNMLRLQAADGSTVAELGPNGNLTLGGGGGFDGDLYLKDPAGITRFEFNANGQSLRIRNAGNQQVGSLGENANLRLGGNGSDGDVVLSDANGTTRLELDADNQWLRIRNSRGSEVGRLGDNANLTLGGNGSDGDVDLYDSNGRRRILLNADGQSLSLYDAEGRQVGSLGPDSNLRLGGHGSDGDVLLYASGANDIFDTGAATIHLDGNAGDITLRNADCAEEFEVLPTVCAEPGTVMALGPDGRLRPSCRAHETGVVGVVSGAGAYQPGIVLDKQPGRKHRRPIALVGKAYVKVTDEAGPIRIGDLLTPSSLEGHAMRATDPMRAFGAVIGKAIAPHEAGAGLIPMVIALQ
ncbi:hypothetical protein [Ideonella sp. BN130291]|uniref:hypothetical protein n=1 Tax=Ideonella sp. BN130291 TaxID=3112940 RepID=UPI002E263918|nr:hypothetical protein [Ideonella sp. BN130291]